MEAEVCTVGTTPVTCFINWVLGFSGGDVGNLILGLSALLGFNAWRKQLIVSRKLSFLDELGKAATIFTLEARKPVIFIEFVLAPHAKKHSTIDSFIQELVQVKETKKKDAAADFSERVDKLESHSNELIRLRNKGRAFGLKDYDTIAICCNRLLMLDDFYVELANFISSRMQGKEYPNYEQQGFDILKSFNFKEFAARINEETASFDAALNELYKISIAR